MRARVALGIGSLLVACASGSGEVEPWPLWTWDEANSRHNPGDVGVGPGDADRLALDWSVDGPGVTSTPVIVDGVVYIGRWDQKVSALDARSGEPVWEAEVGAVVNASLAVTEARVYASVGAEVVALDRADGSEVWRTSISDHDAAQLFGTPTVIEAEGEQGYLVIGSASIELVEIKDDYTFRGSVVALDPADGTELWRFWTSDDTESSGAGVSVWSSAAVDRGRGLVYIGTGNTYEAPASPYSDALLALDYRTGELVWHRQFTAGDVYTVFDPAPEGPDADVGATPNLFSVDGRDVVGVGDKAGVYSVLDRDTGEVVWARQLPEGSPLGGIMVSASVADGRIYVTSNQWVDPFDSELETNVGTAFALDARDGSTVWERPLPAPSFGAVATAGGLVWLTTTRGAFFALDMATGEVAWTDAPGDSAGGGITVSGGRVYVGHGFSLFKNPRLVRGGLAVYAR